MVRVETRRLRDAEAVCDRTLLQEGEAIKVDFLDTFFKVKVFFFFAIVACLRLRVDCERRKAAVAAWFHVSHADPAVLLGSSE